MKCQLCKNGTTTNGRVTVTLERGNTVVVIKNVPAEICENCGEYYLDEETTYKILAKAENASLNNAEVEILQYAA